MPGSTDVGDVSYAGAHGSAGSACAAVGTGAHTWQMTAQVGSVLGHKGLLTAGKALALTAARLFEDPSVLERASRSTSSTRRTVISARCPTTSSQACEMGLKKIVR